MACLPQFWAQAAYSTARRVLPEWFRLGGMILRSAVNASPVRNLVVFTTRLPRRFIPRTEFAKVAESVALNRPLGVDHETRDNASRRIATFASCIWTR